MTTEIMRKKNSQIFQIIVDETHFWFEKQFLVKNLNKKFFAVQK